jgi:hypothetical protein
MSSLPGGFRNGYVRLSRASGGMPMRCRIHFLLLFVAVLSQELAAQKHGEVSREMPGPKSPKGEVLEWNTGSGGPYWYRIPKKTKGKPALILMLHGTGCRPQVGRRDRRQGCIGLPREAQGLVLGAIWMAPSHALLFVRDCPAGACALLLLLPDRSKNLLGRDREVGDPDACGVGYCMGHCT